MWQRLSPPSRGRKGWCRGKEGGREEEVAGKQQAMRGRGEGKESWTVTHLWTAIGSSHEPGTDWTTMLDPLTPHSSNLALVPARRGSMMVSFQRAWMMPMRRPLPSWCCGAGPLVCTIVCMCVWFCARKSGLVYTRGSAVLAMSCASELSFNDELGSWCFV